ncbi:MAG: PrsW family glutamic-type intramembrane protease [Candidatus Gracilibacteria bacterium]|nr:PrsW family glutamic-type intramembrane protease [Candidatus Gracilibacteria bacterium]
MSVYIFLNPQSRLNSFRVAVYGIFYGILAMIPVLLLQIYWATYPDMNIFRILQGVIPSSYLFFGIFFLFAAVLEEVLKALALILLVQQFYKSFDQIVDGIVFGAFVALGFAFAENIYYFTYVVESYQYSMEFLAVFNLRSFGTMLSHTVFTGTFGIFYALAYFGNFKKDTSFSFRKILQLRLTRNMFLAPFFKPKHVYRYLVLSEGIFYAFAMHWVFNMLIKIRIYDVEAVYFTLPFLVFTSLWLWSNFFDETYMKVIRAKVSE